MILPAPCVHLGTTVHHTVWLSLQALVQEAGIVHSGHGVTNQVSLAMTLGPIVTVHCKVLVGNVRQEHIVLRDPLCPLIAMVDRIVPWMNWMPLVDHATLDSTAVWHQQCLIL